MSFKQEYQSTNEWKAEGGFGINLGIAKIGGGGGGGGTSRTAMEVLGKTVAKVSTHHASKASATRENTVSSELETSEASEFEQITERKVKNVNLSRVLNVVCRELNQELISYLSLIDISLAFANDSHIFEEFPLSEVDRMLEKYLGDHWPDQAPGNPEREQPRAYVKGKILEQIQTVTDYQGSEKDMVEHRPSGNGGTYWRIRRRSSHESKNPFYPNSNEPVDGVVVESTKNVVRTDGIIMDALLGHGVALDTYALATQQENIRTKQLRNQQLEKALFLIDVADKDKSDLFRALLVDTPEAVVNRLASLADILDNQRRKDNE